MNYYETLVEKIEKLLTEKEYKQALSLIDEELGMPYVPQDTLDKLENLKAEAISYLPKKENTLTLNEEQIIPFLKKDNESAMAALQFLSSMNIRNYIDVITEALNDAQINHIMKAILIELMVNQQIDQEISYSDGEELTVNPIKLLPVLKQPYVLKTYELLSKMVAQNPSFLDQCSLVLSNAAYDLYPKQLEETQLSNLAYSIIKYVCDAYENTELWKEYQKRYQIDEKVLQTFAF